MQDKIKQANELDRRIQALKDLLWICENGSGESPHKDSKNSPRINAFNEFGIRAAIWTGSDNPYFRKQITNSEDIDLLVDCFKENLKILITNLEEKLKQMFV